MPQGRPSIARWPAGCSRRQLTTCPFSVTSRRAARQLHHCQSRNPAAMATQAGPPRAGRLQAGAAAGAAGEPAHIPGQPAVDPGFVAIAGMDAEDAVAICAGISDTWVAPGPAPGLGPRLGGRRKPGAPAAGRTAARRGLSSNLLLKTGKAGEHRPAAGACAGRAARAPRPPRMPPAVLPCSTHHMMFVLVLLGSRAIAMAPMNCIS